MIKNLSEIRSSIQKGDLQGAARQLLELARSHAPNLYNEVVIHNANTNQLVTDERKGLLNSDTVKQQKNRIMYALLELIDEIEQTLEEKQSLSSEHTPYSSENQPDISLASLQTILVERFNSAEIKSLSFHAGINYEELPGETLANKCIELIQYCHRRQMIPSLIQKIKELRPDINIP